MGSIPWSGTSTGEGSGNPLQYSGLENSMEFIVHGVAKNWTQLSCFHFDFQRSRALETEPDVKNERRNT